MHFKEKTIMDPLAQGALGAVTAQSFVRIDKQNLGVACCGFQAGA